MTTQDNDMSMIDTFFENVSDNSQIENVPYPWIYSLLSAVNYETTAEGRVTTLSSKSSVRDLKAAILALNPRVQLDILTRTFNAFNQAVQTSVKLREDTMEYESTKNRNVIVRVTVFTLLGLLSAFVLAVIYVGITGKDAEMDMVMGNQLFSTILEVIKLLFQ